MPRLDIQELAELVGVRSRQLCVRAVPAIAQLPLVDAANPLDQCQIIWVQSSILLKLLPEFVEPGLFLLEALAQAVDLFFASS